MSTDKKKLQVQKDPIWRWQVITDSHFFFLQS